MKRCEIESGYDVATAFNWTKVELKPGIFLVVAIWKIAFNWTKVELKPVFVINGEGEYKSF